MLVGSVACVDDGNGGNLAGILGSSLDIVAHGNHVGIVAHHQDGVLQRLALGSAGHFGVGKTDDTGAQTVGCRLKAQTCTGGWFKEKSCHYFALK